MEIYKATKKDMFTTLRVAGPALGDKLRESNAQLQTVWETPEDAR